MSETQLGRLVSRLEHLSRSGRRPIELVMSEALWRELKRDAAASADVVVGLSTGSEPPSVQGVPIHFADGVGAVQIVYEVKDRGEPGSEVWAPR